MAAGFIDGENVEGPAGASLTVRPHKGDWLGSSFTSVLFKWGGRQAISIVSGRDSRAIAHKSCLKAE